MNINYKGNCNSDQFTELQIQDNAIYKILNEVILLFLLAEFSAKAKNSYFKPQMAQIENKYNFTPIRKSINLKITTIMIILITV